MDFLRPVDREQRLAHLRVGTVDLALIDVATLVDAAGDEPATFDARCVLVLTQRLPMAAIHVSDRAPITGPDDLAGARYGGPPRFVAEHDALLGRLGVEDRSLRVALGRDEVSAALADGRVDVVPDYASTAPRYDRDLGGEGRVGALAYRDCGVRAYGIGFVAPTAALQRRAGEVAAFLRVAVAAYERMRDDPVGVLADAVGLQPSLEPGYALRQWQGEEEALVFGYEAADRGLGACDRGLWAETVAWRQEVVGFPRRPAPEALYAPLLQPATA